MIRGGSTEQKKIQENTNIRECLSFFVRRNEKKRKS
jgi:hypothetical protein